MNTRLTTVAPDLVEFGAGLSAVQRKTVAGVAAEWACRKSGAVSLLGEDRLQLMLQSAHTATQQDRQTLSGEVEDFDEKYFAIVDKYDGLDEAGEALLWFAKARATASLLYSLDSEDLLSFCEALYEAQAATDDLDELRELCRQ
ncbi:replication initiation protein [Ralstonia pseudosolanacearum]